MIVLGKRHLWQMLAVLVSALAVTSFVLAHNDDGGKSFFIDISLPEGLSDDDFIGVNRLADYVAADLREGESAQEFYFDDLMGMPAEQTDEGYLFSNKVLLIKDSAEIQKLSDWADRKGARSYLVNDGHGDIMVFRNGFHSQRPGDPVINSSSIQTGDDTNLCGYIAVSYIYNGLMGDTTFTPLEVILAQTTLPAGRGLTTFFPALPPLALHLGGITARDLSIVSNVVLEGTGYVSRLYTGLHSDTEIRNMIVAELRQGLPVIAFVNIHYEGTSTGFRADANGFLRPGSNYGHFVVVTGFADHDGENYYRIRNPYDNRTEYYTEDEFFPALIKSADTEFVGSLILFELEQPENMQ